MVRAAINSGRPRARPGKAAGQLTRSVLLGAPVSGVGLTAGHREEGLAERRWAPRLDLPDDRDDSAVPQP